MINKIVNKLKLIYYVYKLNRLVDSHLSRDDFRKETPLSSSFGLAFGGADTYEVEDETNRIYFEAFDKIKKGINRKVKLSGKDHDSVLKEFENLAILANKNPSEVTEILKQIYVYKDQDISSDKDKELMIDKRIVHYKQLQQAKLERELRKKIRQANKEGNKELEQQLTEEWKVKYGKSATH